MTPHVHFRRDGDVISAQLHEWDAAIRLAARIDLELHRRIGGIYTPATLELAERARAGLRDLAVLLGIERGERV